MTIALAGNNIKIIPYNRLNHNKISFVQSLFRAVRLEKISICADKFKEIK